MFFRQFLGECARNAKFGAKIGAQAGFGAGIGTGIGNGIGIGAVYALTGNPPAFINPPTLKEAGLFVGKSTALATATGAVFGTAGTALQFGLTVAKAAPVVSTFAAGAAMLTTAVAVDEYKRNKL